MTEPRRKITEIETYADRPGALYVTNVEATDEPVPEPPDPIPPIPIPPPVDRLLCLTLDESNCGGDEFPGAPTSGYGRYYTTNVDVSYATLDWTGHDSKAFLASSAGGSLHRCIIKGGEDAFHCNGGEWTLTECIFEDLDYQSDGHNDSLQMTSGGAGGSVTAADSVFVTGFRMQGGMQFNIGRKFEGFRLAISGGVYGAYGDDRFAGDIDFYDCLYGWGTTQYGPIAGKARDHGGVWWDPRDMRTRQVGPYKFDPEQTHNNRGDVVAAVAPGGVYAGPPNGSLI